MSTKAGEVQIDDTESLLKELHETMMTPMHRGLDRSKITHSDFNPFAEGAILREPIFYGPESAYLFQYRDFSLKKYAKDNDWFKTNKEFSIEEAQSVICSIGCILNEKPIATLNDLMGKAPHEWTWLPIFTLSATEIASQSGIDKSIVDKILQGFTPLEGIRNQDFNAINDFNVTNAYPLIDLGNDEYLLFQNYSLVEALYETPFYWMVADEAYVNKAMSNRGDFTEEFSVERLELVFGKDRVFKNIDIIDSKKHKAGEIDVLVIYANRAIVLQAKSKKLTLEARKGNDSIIKEDFKKSIQESYDQGLSCARLLTDENYKLVDINSRELNISRNLKEINILCVVSDHYPALSLQARQFLQSIQTDIIMRPLVMDIFTLDVMTEMLRSPLYFLSYINRRTQYSEEIYSSHELTILSFHLKQNLWIKKEYDFYYLGDDISADLDISMMVRRDGIPGERTPDGILTKFKGTTIGNIIQEIEDIEESSTVDLGFMLLMLSEKGMLEIGKGIDTIIDMTNKDGKLHDLTVGIGSGSTGLTIHCSNDPMNIAATRLQGHCKIRKYDQKADNWFGICVNPDSRSLKFGLKLEFPWKKSEEMGAIVKDFLKGQRARTGKKIGRNEPCPCGSGIKYKKCCIKN